MFQKFPFYKQLDTIDCGPTCLKMVAKFHGKYFDLQYLRDKSYLTREGVSLDDIAEAAEGLGMHTFASKISFQTLRDEAPLPCIVYWRKQHFVVVYKVGHQKVVIADPQIGIMELSNQEFVDFWVSKDDGSDGGFVLLLEPTPKFYELDEIPSKSKNGGLFFLSRHLIKYKSYLVQLFVGLIVVGFIQLLFPFSTQAIVDYGIKTQNVNFIILVLLAQFVLIVSQNLADIFRSWLLLHMGNRISFTIVSDFLTKLLRLPISFFEQRLPGDIMQRINDNYRIEHLLSTEILNMVFSFFSFFIFSLVLFYYNVKIALVFVCATAFYIVWVSLFSKKRAILDEMRFAESSYNASSMLQLIYGVQEIKLNNSDKRRRWEWEQVRAKLFKISVDILKVSQYQISGAQIIHDLKNIVISYLAAISVVNGEMTLGMMLSIQYIVGQMNSPLSSIPYFIQAYQDARISFERLAEIDKIKDEYEHEGERLNDSKIAAQEIEFKNVSFRYGGNDSNWVLSKLNFKIPAGKTTAIVGASGGGKTSLLKLLLKFYEPTEGKIAIGNIDIKKFDTKMWRDSVGAVMQDGYVFSDSIERNITESISDRALDKEWLKTAINISNLGEVIDNLPLGIRTRIGANRMQLSGGEKQRILIARAVYKDPEFLFLDEATSALDSNNEKGIMEKFSDFSKEKTVLVIAHRLSTVKNADQIIVLEKGKIVESGTHLELINRKGTYFTLVSNQLELAP